MERCFSCDSTNIKKLGMRFSGKNKGRGFKCNNCQEVFVEVNESDATISEQVEPRVAEDRTEELIYIREPEYIEALKSERTLVFVCAVNNTNINTTFFEALQAFINHRQAKLVVLPIRYKNPSMINSNESVWYDDKLVPYLVENNIDLQDNIRVLGGIKVQATVDNPLSGIEGLSKGSTVIVPHPQLAMRTLSRQTEKYPALATTTGAITLTNYSNTKAGFKAGFNHSFSAVMLEYGKDGNHFIRHLNFDGTGFYDLDVYYSSEGHVSVGQSIEAIVTGDSHVMFHDSEVGKATFDKETGLVAKLKPKYIVRHDLLDFFSRSHHSKNDWVLNYAKHHDVVCGNVQVELNQVISFLNDTTPEGTVNVVVCSNHNNHLKRWLLEANPKDDPENALIYHWLSYKILTKTRMIGNKLYSPDPFVMYLEDQMNHKTDFVSENDSYKIKDIEVGIHGHVGINGARGTPKSFSNVPMKTISGHAHTVSVEKGAYIVGTSSEFKLPYVKGLSSWDHAHCIIHQNGKRQMVFIRNGKWQVE